MKENINEEVLSVLRKNKLTNQIEVDYVSIEKPLAKIIDNFSALCDNPNSTLQQVINFIRTTNELNQLTTHYRYCVCLSGSYQAFDANNQDTIAEIINRQQLMLLNQKNRVPKVSIWCKILGYIFVRSPTDDVKNAITDYKKELKAKYILWSKAFSIDKTYRLCEEDKSIMAYSHRSVGFTNPVYQLTTNFSVEIKTNFGYGRSSYFYSILKYKNIEITPFSEWIDYEFAKFSEIVRYTQSHLLRNEYWLEAMDFSKDACNLSMADEVKFVEKYVIDECESMVSGLEDIFRKESFSFKHIKKDQDQYKVDKKGHVLVEFRGEKISGALDFISKILEFEKIASIKSFINRIEECNIRIQPILIVESKIIKVKISNLTAERNALKLKYDKVIKDNNDYNRERAELQNQMISSGQLNVKEFDFEKFLNEFCNKYPDYVEFVKEYNKVTKNYSNLNEQIQNLTTVYYNIVSYNEKIMRHFGK